jgi:hypothetical protein
MVGAGLQTKFIKFGGLNSVKPLLWGWIMECIVMHSSSGHNVEGTSFSPITINALLPSVSASFLLPIFDQNDGPRQKYLS